MPALFANTLHEAIVALGGDINWWTTDEIVAGLHEAGALFVTIVLVRTLLKSKPRAASHRGRRARRTRRGRCGRRPRRSSVG